MTVEVVYTDEFGAWYEGLSEVEQDRVYRSVGLLEELGVLLRFAHSSAIKGASFALRELRTQVEGDPIRTLYMPSTPREGLYYSSEATSRVWAQPTTHPSQNLGRRFGAT